MTERPLAKVLTVLDYHDDKGLVTTDTSKVESRHELVWMEARDKLNMDAVYFNGNVPVVYFKEFGEFNNEELWQLHRSLWNHNRAPILIAVLPNEVRIYNCFATPSYDKSKMENEGKVLLKKDSLEAAELFAFKRREMASGRFARTLVEDLDPEERVDKRLLENLKSVRSLLINKGLKSSLANRLIGRCIFISYLLDRRILRRGTHPYLVGDSPLANLLMSSKENTYQLFEKLTHRFNGDLFPVDDTEGREVKECHLLDLGKFFRGDEIPTGQMHFWPYDFNFIPIEMISTIYETFLDEIREKTGAFYTPPQIVDFVLGELLSNRKKAKKIRILDPSCGSGIFLIEAYRRLVILNSRFRKKLNFEELRDLLTESIYGVDINGDAIEVAIFSCCLALLDSLGTDDMPENPQLPTLKDNNLFVSDFFDLDAKFSKQTYDIIVGNPPWRSGLTDLAQKIIGRYRDRYPLGDKQIAQAFLWHAPALLAENGQICLLCPSKSVLYNQTGTHRRFRQKFFESYRVTQIADFSEFRVGLFRNSRAPMVAVFYRKGPVEDANHVITHIGLHRSLQAEILAGVVIYGDEKKPIPYKQAIKNLGIWKIALWGTPRDLAFIDDLKRRFPTLDEVIEDRKWTATMGVTVNGKNQKYTPDLNKMRFVPTKAVNHLLVSSAKGLSIKEDWFERPRGVEKFRGPHVLIRRGLTGKGFLNAAFLPEAAVFKNSVYGISGPAEDTDYLKLLSAYLNSSVARYYHFLTSSSWGVERSELLLKEHRGFPCPIPDKNDSLFREVVSLVDHVRENGPYDSWRSDLDKLICKIYDLTPSEQIIMGDFTETVIDLHHSGTLSKAYDPPSESDLTRYSQTYEDVFTSLTGKSSLLNSSARTVSSTYCVVSFSLASESKLAQSSLLEKLYDERLAILEEIANEQDGERSQLRKNIRVYEGKTIHIMKPGERRFWTRLAAYNDADATLSELLRVDNSQQ